MEINSKETGTLIAFKLKKEVKSTERTRFFRKLYGCTDKSYYGKYTYKRKGILDDISHRVLIRAVIIVREEDAKELIDFLSDKAEVYVRKVILEEEDNAIFEQKE